MNMPSSIQSHQLLQGFTLTEVMIGLAAGLVMIAAMLQLFIGSRTSLSLNYDVSQTSFSGQTSLQILKSSIVHAGAWGVNPESVQLLAGLSVSTQDAACTPNWVFDTTQHIQGFDGGDTLVDAVGNPIASCFATDHYVADSDILIVRSANQSLVTSTANLFGSNDYFIRNYLSTLEGMPTIGTGNQLFAQFNADETNGVVDPSIVYNMSYQTEIFYLRSCSEINNTGACLDDTPSLMHLRLSNGSFESEVIMQGIVQLQFEYGLDINGISGNENTHIINQYQSANQVANWDHVTNVHIALLARGLESSPILNQQQTTTVNMIGDLANPGYTIPIADQKFRHQLFVQNVHLRKHQRLL